MGPKKARISRKRSAAPSPDTLSPNTPVPGSDSTPSPLQVRTRSKRARFSGSPFRGSSSPVSTGSGPPSSDGQTITQEQQEKLKRYREWVETSSDFEQRIDWYVEVAMEKIKSVLHRANEDKLSRADLWELLTFGQHMYAGMNERYNIDLNTALIKRTVKNTAKGLTLLGQPQEFPWDLPEPDRCPTCERVVVQDLDPLSPRRPWNRAPMTDDEAEDLLRDLTRRL